MRKADSLVGSHVLLLLSCQGPISSQAAKGNLTTGLKKSTSGDGEGKSNQLEKPIDSAEPESISSFHLKTEFTECEGEKPERKNLTPEERSKQLKQSTNALQMGGALYETLRASQVKVAIIGRAGTDFSDEQFRSPSKQKYSHVGFALRNGDNDLWTAIRLLHK